MMPLTARRSSTHGTAGDSGKNGDPRHLALAQQKQITHHGLPHRCIVSKHMTNYFGKVDAEAAAAHATLERRTLAMALAEIREVEAAG
jgi:hypothetical protein